MYPIMINIKDKPVIIVGGGKVAARKILPLLAEGAQVTVISPSLNEKIPQEQINWVKRHYQYGDLDDAKLVFACTNQEEVNRQIIIDAHPSQLVNNTGDKYFSDFYNVAIAKASDFSVMISTNGLSPSRAKEVRKKLENILQEL